MEIFIREEGGSNMVIVTAHQPNYLPYLGFFDKMRKADIFVILDDVQFNNNDFQQRNRIRVYDGYMWLRIPVEEKPIPINHIKIRNEIKFKNLHWNDYHLKQIQENYRNAPCFDNYIKVFEEIYKKQYSNLVDINIELIKILREVFDVDDAVLIKSSDLSISTMGTQRIIDIVKLLGGTKYISGEKGINYLEIDAFKRENIALEFQNFKHPIYKQCYKGFIPNMASIDTLFNLGRYPHENY